MHDDLNAARGIMFGAALGAMFWLVMLAVLQLMPRLPWNFVEGIWK